MINFLAHLWLLGDMECSGILITGRRGVFGSTLRSLRGVFAPRCVRLGGVSAAGRVRLRGVFGSGGLVRLRGVYGSGGLCGLGCVDDFRPYARPGYAWPGPPVLTALDGPHRAPMSVRRRTARPWFFALPRIAPVACPKPTEPDRTPTRIRTNWPVGQDFRASSFDRLPAR